MKNIKKIKKIIYILITLIISIILISCKMAKDPIDISFFALDTMIAIRAFDYKNKNKATEYLQQCKIDIETFENNMSKTIGTSYVSLINDKNITFDEMDEDVKEIIIKALEYKENISPLFDIYLGELIDLWDEAKSKKVLPKKEDIDNALVKINAFDFSINNVGAYCDNNKCKMDLGGVAKGYIADKLASKAKEYDVHSCIINLGGNVYVVGDKYGEPYVVGIYKPFQEGELAEKVECKNTSVVTSGIYQRYYQIANDDTIYHHILDKRTGYPAESGIISATIVSDSSMIADMLATTCVIVGEQEAIKLFEKAKEFYKLDMKMILIDSNYNMIKY